MRSDAKNECIMRAFAHLIIKLVILQFVKYTNFNSIEKIDITKKKKGSFNKYIEILMTCNFTGEIDEY